MVGASRPDITLCDQCHRGACASLTWLIGSAAPAAAAPLLARPGTSMTSSTSSGGNALVSTPTEIRSGSQPSGDNASEPS